MKIVRISGLHYRAAQDRLYQEGGSLAERPYAEQQERIFQLCLVYGGSFSRGMRLLGCDVAEILYDVEPLQLAWARENGVAVDRSAPDWRFELVMAQVAALRPDVVYLQDVHGLPSRFRRVLKERVPTVRLIVLHKGYPGFFEEMGDFDLVLMSMPSLVRMYRDKGIPAELHYHGFNGSVPAALAQASPPVDKTLPFTFLGSSGYGHGDGHRTRYWSLMRLFRETPLEGYIDEQFSRDKAAATRPRQIIRRLPFAALSGLQALTGSLPSSRAQRLSAVLGEERQVRTAEVASRGGSIPYDSPPPGPITQFFPQRCHAPVFGLDMYRTLAASRVTLNMHADATGDSVGNLRMFEATGVGACVLTDDGPNMEDLFERDREVVVYHSIDEGVEKLKYLLDHPAECRRIAEAGMARTLRDHTVESRVKNVYRLLGEKLSQTARVTK